MKEYKHFIKLLLDENGTIIEFECSLREMKYNETEVLGKNWFNTFIDEGDREAALKVFHSLLNDKNENTKVFTSDIQCKEKNHKLINFENKLIIKDGKKYVLVYGVEHMDKV